MCPDTLRLRSAAAVVIFWFVRVCGLTAYEWTWRLVCRLLGDGAKTPEAENPVVVSMVLIPSPISPIHDEPRTPYMLD